jgi:putative transposase
VQRCLRHKERNVLEHLPERDRPAVKRRLRAAWADNDHDHALERLRLLAGELDRSQPGAAASLREGLEETLTLTRLGIKGPLKRTLESTNPCESMIECVRRTSRNVKRWQSGDMALRWTAAGMLEAEPQFRKIIGYRVKGAITRVASHAAARWYSWRRPPSRSRRWISPWVDGADGWSGWGGRSSSARWGLWVL